MLPLWRLTTARRKLFEAFGHRSFSRPAFGDIEEYLNKHLPDSGFFVEAGAVDGFFESNTYHLERFHGWKGILIEPVPEMFSRIHVNRPNSLAINAALVSNEHQDSTVPILPNHAMSKITKPAGTINQESIDVPARTLTSILAQFNPPRIDFLSLDVEGFEAEVFKGLDFRVYKPRFILVECLTENHAVTISSCLADDYELVGEPTHRDLFFQAKED